MNKTRIIVKFILWVKKPYNVYECTYKKPRKYQMNLWWQKAGQWLPIDCKKSQRGTKKCLEVYHIHDDDVITGVYTVKIVILNIYIHIFHHLPIMSKNAVFYK